MPDYTTKRVGKLIHYLVTTRLFGPSRLINSKNVTYLHDYLGPTIIRHLKVLTHLLLKTAFHPNIYERKHFIIKGPIILDTFFYTISSD